jgi:hypothetical protein
MKAIRLIKPHARPKPRETGAPKPDPGQAPPRVTAGQDAKHDITPGDRLERRPRRNEEDNV